MYKRQAHERAGRRRGERRVGIHFGKEVGGDVRSAGRGDHRRPEGRVGIHFGEKVGGDVRSAGRGDHRRAEGRVGIHLGEEIGGDIRGAGRGDHRRAKGRVGIHFGEEVGGDRIGAEHRGDRIGSGRFRDSGGFGGRGSLHRRFGQREVCPGSCRYRRNDASGSRGRGLHAGIVQQAFQIIVQLTVGGVVAHAACSIRIASSASTHSSARR
ncbi:hypothetical protein [Xanthomonas arboricola]|uniref:hypothetical protein n=1 Tax=Xanthomonas arboricola TaxID=56448 RepID=UPI003D189FF6